MKKMLKILIYKRCRLCISVVGSCLKILLFLRNAKLNWYSIPWFINIMQGWMFRTCYLENYPMLFLFQKEIMTKTAIVSGIRMHFLQETSYIWLTMPTPTLSIIRSLEKDTPFPIILHWELTTFIKAPIFTLWLAE